VRFRFSLRCPGEAPPPQFWGARQLGHGPSSPFWLPQNWGRGGPLFLLLLVFLSVPALVHADSPVVKTTLPNGLRVLCRREPGTPLVAVDVFVRVGVAQETADTAGMGSFAARTLLASTTSSTPETMSSSIDALGGNVTASWHTDWTQVAALTVPDRLSDTMYLLADVLQNADFDPNAVEQARTQMLTEIDARDADQFSTAYGNLQKALFAGTAYARPDGGTPATIQRLTRDDLARYYRRYYIPQNIVIVVVGNVSPEAATAQIQASLGDFVRVGTITAPAGTPLPPLAQPQPPTRVYQTDLTQQLVLAGVRAVPASDPDYPALLVANALLGSMKSGRLFTQLREKEGLAYDLGSLYTPRLTTGDLTAYVYSAPTRTDPVTKKTVPTVGPVKLSLFAQFAALADAPPTPAALVRAQHFLIGTDALKHERLEDRATLLGVAELTGPEGYTLDTELAKYINAVTGADVQRVARKYFAYPVLSTVEPQLAAGGGGMGQ